MKKDQDLRYVFLMIMTFFMYWCFFEGLSTDPKTVEVGCVDMDEMHEAPSLILKAILF